MNLLRDLNRNARVSLTVIPMWSVFWGLVYFYSPLYMKSLGLGEVEIGVVNTVGMVFAFLCFVFASPITNRFGRKRTTLVFDLLSWSVPMLIWAVAGNFWFFLVAAIINALSKIVTISWNCLITEDEKREKIPKIFTLVSLVNSAIGVFAPITGFFIARVGLVSSMRGLYAVGALSMAAMFVIRNRFVIETAAGRKLMVDHNGAPAVEGLKRSWSTILCLRRNRGFVFLLIVFATTNFIASLNVFQVIYLKEQLSFSESSVSLVPFVVAVANVAVFVLVLPRLKKARNESTLAAFIALNFVASILFVLVPVGALVSMLVVMALNGAANFVLQGYRESVFMSYAGEFEKADMYSAVQTLTFLCCIPAGYQGGLLYRVNAQLPFVLVAVLYAVALAASLAFRMGVKP
jgi:MFS family permease